MHEFTIERAIEQINYSKAQKRPLIDTWRNTSLYYSDDILDERGYDPEKLVSERRGKRWGIDNHIPDAVRDRIAFAMSSPLDVDMHALAPTDDVLAHEAVQAIYKNMLHELEEKEFDRVKRDLMVRGSLFNMSALLDWWEDDRYNPRPGYRVISHDDIFFDSTASAPINQSGGARWVAIRRMLSEDEKISRYGRVALRKGHTGREKTDKPKGGQDAWRVYGDQYEIFEWYGINLQEEPIPSEEMETMIVDEINALFRGELVEPDLDINHRKAVEVGDELMRGQALSVGAGVEEVEDIVNVLNILGDAGLGQYADLYSTWRKTQIDLAAESEGGTRPLYDGYLYRAEFQIGHPELLIEPVALGYPHYQIPVSLFWTHQPTDYLWNKGMMSRVLAHQEWIEWWQKCRQDYSNYSARPPFLIDTSTLDPPARTDETKMAVKESLVRGLRIMWMKLQNKPMMEPHFASPGNFPIDVTAIIQYHQYRIKEILGPTPTLQGNVSGETSGRAFGMRTEAAGRPVIDMLKIYEGPLEAAIKRMSMNIFEFGDLDKIESIAGPTGADAVEAMREEVESYGRDFRFTIHVDLGSGVPRDFYSLAAFGQAFAPYIDMEEFGRVIKSPITLRNLPTPTPGAPAGQGGNIDKGLIPATG